MFPPTTKQNCASSYVQHFNEVDISGITFKNGLKTEEVPKLETKNKSSPKVFELKVKVKQDLSVASKLLPLCFSDGQGEPKDK